MFPLRLRLARRMVSFRVSAFRGVTIALLALSPALRAQTPGAPLSQVLAQMDSASKTFQSASASFEWDFYERVVRDTTKQKGTMFIQRGKSGTSFGAVVFDVDAGGTAAATPSRIVSFDDGTLRLYTPAEHQVDQFKAGNQASAESYLSLGFGGSGQALAAAWQVTDGGAETLTDSGRPVKTEKLLLVSKDPAVRNTFSRVTLWIDPVRDVSLKQVFETPAGDQRTATYSNIRLNTRIDQAPYKIPSKGTTVVPH